MEKVCSFIISELPERPLNHNSCQHVTHLLIRYTDRFWYTQNIPMQKSATARLARKKFVIVLSRLDTSTTRITSRFPTISAEPDNICACNWGKRRRKENDSSIFIFSYFPHNFLLFHSFHWYYSDFSYYFSFLSFFFASHWHWALRERKSKFRFYYNSLSTRLNLDTPHWTLFTIDRDHRGGSPCDIAKKKCTLHCNLFWSFVNIFSHYFFISSNAMRCISRLR